MALRLTDIVAQLPAAVPFVAPEESERASGKPFRWRAGANESAFGISPLARQAMYQAIEQLNWYNDPSGYELRATLAAHHALPLTQIALGSGIDDLLGTLVRAFVSPGDAVVTSRGAYPTFDYHVNGFGGIIHAVPYRDDREDLPALMARAAATGAKLIYFANPDNPMGTWWSPREVAAASAGLPPDCLLLLDEAYVEFAPSANLALPASDQVVRLRTFSKAHGLAGARIGYAIGSAELVSALDRIRNHFGVNRIAQAGALASLRDSAFLRDVVRQVAAGRQAYEALARSLGLTPLPSATNFVTVDVGSAARARALLSRLAALGVFIRMPGVAPLDRCIRLTVLPAAQHDELASALEAALRDTGGLS